MGPDGQGCGQPVSRLLGGNYRDQIRPYGSILFDEPDPLRKTLTDVVERGFRSIKLGWRPFGRRDRAFDELLVKTARQTVGDNVELMVDAGGSEQFWPHGVNWAKNTAKMLADYGILWFGEPLPPGRYRRLPRTDPHLTSPNRRRRSLHPPSVISSVDRAEGGRHSPAGLHQNGGLSESRRIAWTAYDHNIQVIPHGWNTAIASLPIFSFSAAIPVARYVEYLTPCAYIDELTTEPFSLNADGYLDIPARPGSEWNLIRIV